MKDHASQARINGKVVLITGCSTGIGRQLARSLAQAGCTVVATARELSSIQDLPVALALALDVTRPESVKQALDALLQRFGRLDVLINNAGYAQVGAIEELSDERLQQMYAVNLFGALRMTRAVLPILRRQGAGRILNISSIAGLVVTPVNGAYASSKFALEAVSDALRWEVAPFNIQVSLIEPGAIKTQFDQTVHRHGDALTENPASPYRSLYRKAQQVSDGMRGQEPGPEVVARVVLRALGAARPKARYLAGVDLPTRLVLSLRGLLWQSAVHQLYNT